MSKDIDCLFNEFLLGMVNKDNASLIKELKHRWEEYKATPIINPTKKPVLFTTEDGVDVYDGDKIYWVNITSYSTWGINEYKLTKQADDNYDFVSGKYFFSKTKAQEYILMNKPCLSVNDIVDFLHEEFMFDGIEYKNLKELAKSKQK